MSQPTFIQKKDGSGVGVNSLNLTPGSATTAGNMLLVGVVMTPTGAESPQSVAAIVDSAGDVGGGGGTDYVDANLQTLSGWARYVGSGIGGVAPTSYGFIQDQPPSGTAMELYTTGPAYADWLAHLGRPIYPLNIGQLNMQFTLNPDTDSTTHAQAIEFDTRISSGGWNYNFSCQLDYAAGGKLQISSQGGGWVDTGFTPGILAPNVAHTILCEYQFNFTSKTYSYIAVSIDGTRYVIGSALQNLTPTNIGWADGAYIQLQQDLNSGGGTFTMLVDDLDYLWPTGGGGGGGDTGVPVNTWSRLGSNTDDNVHTEWWACRSVDSITYLDIDITGTGEAGAQDIIAVLLEYSGANGVTNPVFQPLQANQNTITSQYILETVATIPNSGAELMIGLFAMLSDTFNATALEGTARSTNSVSIPPSLSYQVIEQATVQANTEVVTVDGELITLAGDALNITAWSATQLASAANVAASSMQCLYIVISGGLILNTQPGFSDQPDSVLAAGNYALGLQLAKINGNAALGMCRMEFFQGVYTNGQTVDLPVSSVDGYQYSINECIFMWQVFNSANPGSGWITGPTSLWYCGWNVDQETGDVTCDEWYRNASASADSQDGSLQVFIIGQRQQETLTAATQPTWTQQNASLFVTDLAYSSDVLTAFNENAKFAVLGQECVSMGEFYDGQTIPRPVSPADDYEYAYSEVTFVYSWRWTCGQAAYGPPAWEPYEGLGALYAVIAPTTGVVTCGIGWSENDGNNYAFDYTYGRLAVFAFCQRARTGTPAEVGKYFAEIPNTLFYPGSVLPAGIGAQLCRNINEAALSPEFFGPTNYLPGATIPTPTSAIDGYAYQRTELIYLWQWHVMDTGVNDNPTTYSSGTHVRTPLFSAAIDQTTGLVSTEIWHLAPGGPYTEYTTTGILSVVVVGFRSSQQTEVSGNAVQAPSDAGSTITDQQAAGAFTVNGV